MSIIAACDVCVHTVCLVYMCMLLVQDTVVIMYCTFFIITFIDGKLMSLCISIFLQAIHSIPELPRQDLRGDKRKRASDTSQSLLQMSQLGVKMMEQTQISTKLEQQMLEMFPPICKELADPVLMFHHTMSNKRQGIHKDLWEDYCVDAHKLVHDYL